MNKKVIEEFVKTLTEEDIARFRKRSTPKSLDRCIAVDAYAKAVKSVGYQGTEEAVKAACALAQSTCQKYRELCIRICSVLEDYLDPIFCYAIEMEPPCPCRAIHSEGIRDFTQQALALLDEKGIKGCPVK